MDAPVIAVARGLIATQVPYELQPLQPLELVAVQVFENGVLLDAMTVQLTGHALTLFDTGQRDTLLNLQTLAALNEDGTVNTKSNPVPAGPS